MMYRLVITESNEVSTKDVGDNIFLDNLSNDYKVYLFYYSGVFRNETLEEKMTELGNLTGKNLFVNLGKLNDPNFDKISKAFDIQHYPVIIMTAVKELASIKDPLKFSTAYIKIDNEKLLNSVDLTIKCVEQVFTLFNNGKIMEALDQVKNYERKNAIFTLKIMVISSLKQIANFLSDKDISVSFLGFNLELKPSSSG